MMCETMSDDRERPSNTEKTRTALAATSARAYASDWAAFTSWCLLERVQALPASISDVLQYLKWLLPTARVSTLRRKLVSIGRNHRERGHAFPARDARVLEFFRTAVTEPTARATPRGSIDACTVEALVAALPATIAGVRDRALILVGWTLGFRPSELIGLDSAHLRVQAASIHVTVTPHHGEPKVLRLVSQRDPEICPVRWLKSWLSVSHPTSGPVFRPVTRFGSVLPNRMSVQSVRLVLKRAARRAGIQSQRLTGDSLRKGPMRQIAS